MINNHCLSNVVSDPGIIYLLIVLELYSVVVLTFWLIVSNVDVKVENKSS